jgi:hypothetical protein
MIFVDVHFDPGLRSVLESQSTVLSCLGNLCSSVSRETGTGIVSSFER